MMLNFFKIMRPGSVCAKIQLRELSSDELCVS